MEKDINLLPIKSHGFFEQERTVAIARAVATLSVLVVFSVFVGIFFLGKNYSISDVQAQQASVRSRLQLLQGKIQQDLTLVDRTNRIQNVLKTRGSLTAKITSIQKLAPDDITIETFSVTQKTVTIVASSSSLTSLKKFLDSLTALVNKKILFQRITINDLTVNTIEGTYSVDVKGDML